MPTQEQIELTHFEVTGIVTDKNHYYFLVLAHYSNGDYKRVALHSIEKHRSLELFQFHHSEVKARYESLD